MWLPLQERDEKGKKGNREKRKAVYGLRPKNQQLFFNCSADVLEERLVVGGTDEFGAVADFFFDKLPS